MKKRFTILYAIPTFLLILQALLGILNHPFFDIVSAITITSWLATIPIGILIHKIKGSPEYVTWSLFIYSVGMDVAIWTTLIWIVFNLGRIIGALGL